MKNNPIELLKDDANYYGDFGKQYLSNSYIDTLLKNPANFGKPKEKTTAMLIGSYFHALLLEPDKAKEYVIVDASTRTTNIYKEALASTGQDMLILKKEAEDCERMANGIISKLDFYDLIREPNNSYEVPAIGTIGGVEWKGKSDIVNEEILIDLKTTTDIDGFKYSAMKYNYDSQAYIYNQLFGKPLVFIVVEKESNRTGIYECSDEFLDRGREKVYRAIEVYNKFFGPNATDNIHQYYINQIL
jgi:hypothetical protein